MVKQALGRFMFGLSLFTLVSCQDLSNDGKITAQAYACKTTDHLGKEVTAIGYNIHNGTAEEVPVHVRWDLSNIAFFPHPGQRTTRVTQDNFRVTSTYEAENQGQMVYVTFSGSEFPKQTLSARVDDSCEPSEIVTLFPANTLQTQRNLYQP